MQRSTLRRALRAGALCLAASIPAAPAAALPTTIASKRMNVRVGHRAAVSGHLPPQARIAWQIRRRGRWHTLEHARAGATGRYVLRHRLHRAMSVVSRVRLPGGATRRLGHLNVYRAAPASWYGPGLFGGHMACGGTLRPGRLGVAHRWLPCGSKVTLRHRGHIVRVRVVDRGPYAGAREFDLTTATARALRFHGAGTIQVAR